MTDKSAALMVLVDEKLSPAAVRARDALRYGVIPKEHIKKHPGKGGKIFSYVPHVIATRTMDEAFGQMWEWEVLETYFYPDKSAGSRCKMTLNYPLTDGTFYERVITEYGAYEPRGDGMTNAMTVSASVSRCLLRCMLRAFCYGSELYESEDKEETPATAKKLIREYLRTLGVTDAEYKERYDAEGFNDENIIDRFAEAYELAYQIKMEKKERA